MKWLITLCDKLKYKLTGIITYRDWRYKTFKITKDSMLAKKYSKHIDDKLSSESITKNVVKGDWRNEM